MQDINQGLTTGQTTGTPLNSPPVIKVVPCNDEAVNMSLLAMQKLRREGDEFHCGFIGPWNDAIDEDGIRPESIERFVTENGDVDALYNLSFGNIPRFGGFLEWWFGLLAVENLSGLQIHGVLGTYDQ